MDEAGRPRVTVVIPAYNMAEFVGIAITSVLDGSYENVEVIVVDDGSTDETAQVVSSFVTEGSEQYDERVQYVSQPNRGKPAAVNRGIEEMRGTYFALLDADDRLPPRSIERRVGALTAQSDADIAIGGFKVFSEPGTDVLGERPCPCVRNPHRLKHLFCRSYKTPFHFNACLLHRSLIDRVGQFDLQLDRCQDQDYSIRCMENTRGIVLVDAPVYLYRKYRDSPRERLSARVATLRHRPHVILKNFSPPRSYAYTAGMAVVDVGKLVYEIFSNYEN
jgi:glycosyltransferase involved in cell wall biosynthesis